MLQKQKLIEEIYYYSIYNEDVIELNFKFNNFVLYKIEDRKLHYHKETKIHSLFYFEINNYLYLKDIPTLTMFFSENKISLLDLQFLTNKIRNNANN
jgi:hypothetical protein